MRKIASCIALLFVSGSLWLGCGGESAPAESTAGKNPPPTNAAPVEDPSAASFEEDELIETEEARNSRKGLLLCRGNRMRMRHQPNLKSEVKEVFDRNALLFSNGITSDDKDQVEINGFTFNSPWILVEPVAEGRGGWVFFAKDQDQGLIEWLIEPEEVGLQEAKDRNLQVYNLVKQEKIANRMGLEGLDYAQAGPFSGYFFTRNVPGRGEVLDGPFKFSSSTAKDRDHRLTLQGDWSEGQYTRMRLTIFDPPKESTIELTVEDGKCVGRTYTIAQDGELSLEYQDGSCSLDESTCEYDL